MFDYKQYVPILKTKAGERWALSHLPPSDRDHLTPLLEIHPHESRSADIHSREICESFANIWQTRCFLDAGWLHGETGDHDVISTVFEGARSTGLTAIPVARLTLNRPSRRALGRVASQGSLGCLIRLHPGELAYAEAIESLIDDLGLDIQDLDLLIDYRSSEMGSLAADLESVPRLSEWRTLTAASGTFPNSLGGMSSNDWNTVDRTDWNSWESSITNGNLVRIPAFGDYTIRDYQLPPRFGQASVALRYTKNNSWLLRVGGKIGEGHARQIHGFCRELVARSEYDGSDFSQGDMEISDCASRNERPGSATQHIRWCVNHHIVFTTQQIQSLAGL